MGLAEGSVMDVVEEQGDIRIMELVGLWLMLLVMCFCWQLCYTASTSNADALQEHLHPGSTDIQPLSDQNESTERSPIDTDSALEDHATDTDTRTRIHRTEEIA